MNGRMGPDTSVGSRVRYLPDAHDEARANWGGNRKPVDLLDPACTYTVARVEIHSWHTKLWLEDVGGPFNSCHFVDDASDAVLS